MCFQPSTTKLPSGSEYRLLSSQDRQWKPRRQTLAVADQAVAPSTEERRATIPCKHLPPDKYIYAFRAERRDGVENPVGVNFYQILTFGNESGDALERSLREEVRIVLSQRMII